jgi:hypothetical protein
MAASTRAGIWCMQAALGMSLLAHTGNRHSSTLDSVSSTGLVRLLQQQQQQQQQE